MMRTIHRLLMIVIVSIAVGVLLGSTHAEDPLSPAGRVEIGEAAPEFELESLDGDRLNPVSLRGRAPLVLIFFRGTW